MVFNYSNDGSRFFNIAASSSPKEEKIAVKIVNPLNNVYHFTEEFTVSRAIQNEREQTRRPDIILFINGIPFAVIELKKSSVDTQQGISQMIRNQLKGEIQQLFKYVQITLAGNNHSPQYATTGTPKKFYATWEEDVKEEILQQAVEKALEKYPLFLSVMRKGLFWHYLEKINLKPVVTEEFKEPCRNLYVRDKKSLLFEVTYYKRRINFEVFHALVKH